MLTATEKTVLRQIHEGHHPTEDEQIAKLIQGRYVIRKQGHIQITDAGLTELGLARGFGEAIADVIMPGAGTHDSLSQRK